MKPKSAPRRNVPDLDDGFDDDFEELVGGDDHEVDDDPPKRGKRKTRPSVQDRLEPLIDLDDLSAPEMAVLTWIVFYAGKGGEGRYASIAPEYHGRLADPSLTTLERRTRLAHSTVNRAIRGLIDKRYVRIVGKIQTRDNSWHHNVYWLAELVAERN